MNCATMAASIVNKNNSFEVDFKVHNIRNINKSKKKYVIKKPTIYCLGWDSGRLLWFLKVTVAWTLI